MRRPVATAVLAEMRQLREATVGCDLAYPISHTAFLSSVAIRPNSLTKATA
jgi:hypothetical protein